MKHKIILWIAITLIMTVGLIAGQYRHILMPETKEETTYSSLDDLRNGVSFKFNIPKMLTEEDNLTFKSRYGQFIEIGNDKVSFMAAPFVDNKADLEGDYNERKVDKEYKVSGDTSIKYLRVRTDSEDMDNMAETKVNYNTGDTAYSLEFKTKTSYTEVLNRLGLDEKQVNPIEKVQKTEQTSVAEGKNYDEYTLESIGYKISIPKVLTKLNKVTGSENFKYETFILSGKSVLTIEQDNKTEFNGDEVAKVDLADGYIMKFYKNNPFNDGTQEYISYNNILNSISYITKSFKKIDK